MSVVRVTRGARPLPVARQARIVEQRLSARNQRRRSVGLRFRGGPAGNPARGQRREHDDHTSHRRPYSGSHTLLLFSSDPSLLGHRRIPSHSRGGIARPRDKRPRPCWNAPPPPGGTWRQSRHTRRNTLSSTRYVSGKTCRYVAATVSAPLRVLLRGVPRTGRRSVSSVIPIRFRKTAPDIRRVSRAHSADKCAAMPPIALRASNAKCRTCIGVAQMIRYEAVPVSAS